MALEFVRSFHYNLEDIAFLQQIRDYDPAFLDYLSELRFSGEILAMPEGSIAFPNEPLLHVTAPFAEALLLESGLLQAINQSRHVRRVTRKRLGKPAHRQGTPWFDQVQHVALDRREIEFALRRRQVLPLREEELHQELPGPTGIVL